MYLLVDSGAQLSVLRGSNLAGINGSRPVTERIKVYRLSKRNQDRYNSANGSNNEMLSWANTKMTMNSILDIITSQPSD